MYAFDPMNGGKQFWMQATSSQSAVSAAATLVFTVELPPDNMPALIARKQADGTLAWSAAVPGAGAQAPALAGGLVLVGTTSGLMAFDLQSGASKWTTMMPNGYAAPAQLTVGNGCAGTQPLGNLPDTAIAIAAGSGTIVVAAGQKVSLLSLADGKVLSEVTPDGVTGTLVNPILVGKRVYVVERRFPATSSRLIALQAP